MAGKSDLVAKIADTLGTTKATTEVALIGVFEAIQELVETDGKVVLQGFGKFYIKTSKARTGRNPKDGTPLEIAEKSVFAFKAAR